MALFILICGCTKQATVIDMDKTFVDRYSGTYYVTNSHDKTETESDSIGQTIVVTNNYLSTDTIIITSLDNQGTYKIEELIMEGGYKTVQGSIENDTLKVNEDWSTTVRSKWLRGSISIHNDSIFLEYKWNNFDTWSTGVYPNYGEVKAQGTY